MLQRPDGLADGTLSTRNSDRLQLGCGCLLAPGFLKTRKHPFDAGSSFVRKPVRYDVVAVFGRMKHVARELLLKAQQTRVLLAFRIVCKVRVELLGFLARQCSVKGLRNQFRTVFVVKRHRAAPQIRQIN